MQIKDENSSKTEAWCDLRLPMQLRCLDTDFLVMLAHLAEPKEGQNAWMIFPTTSNELSSQYVDNVRLCESMTEQQTLHLLLCLVVEYAQRAKEPGINEQGEKYFNKLRAMTIDTIEKFFPFASKALSDIRLSNLESPAYRQISSTVFIFRVFLAGRLFQFFIERAIDEEMAKTEGLQEVQEESNE